MEKGQKVVERGAEGGGKLIEGAKYLSDFGSCWGSMTIESWSLGF